VRQPDYNRRVAVTGLGVISPIGNDKATAWDNLLNGVSRAGEITYFDVSPYEAKAAGEVKGFNAARLAGRQGPADRVQLAVRRRRGEAGRRRLGLRDHRREPDRRSAWSSAAAPAASS
jgi:3-oxoacyl-(acyl-carrier-protein) synthase